MGSLEAAKQLLLNQWCVDAPSLQIKILVRLILLCRHMSHDFVNEFRQTAAPETLQVMLGSIV